MKLRVITVFILILLLILPVIAVHPAETYIRAAETFREQPGGEESSAAMFEKASELSGGRYDLLREAARMYANAHQYQKAMDTMNQSIRFGGEHAASYLFMGIWAAEGFNNTAMRDEYLRRAISGEVMDAVDAYNKAIAQAFLGDLAEGTRTIVNATEQYNTTDYLWDWRGLYKAAEGNYSDALSSYDQAIILSTEPRTKASNIMKKATYVAIAGMGTPEDMLNMRDQAISLDKEIGTDFVAMIGTEYSLKGDYQNASGYFEPGKSPYYQKYSIDDLLRADYLYKSGDRKEAVRIYEKAKTLAEEKIKTSIWANLMFRINLNRAESGLFRDAMDKQKKESALSYATSLTQRNPDNPVYKQNFADAQNLTIRGKT